MWRMLAGATFVLGLSICPTLLAQGSEMVREAQYALKNRGYDPGAMDGVCSAKTRAAVRDFQKNSDLAVDGRLGRQTLTSLGVINAGADRFHTAGTNVKQSYASGGKQIGKGGRALGSDIRHGEVVDGGRNFGRDVGYGAARIGKGTGHAAANAARGVKDAVTGNK